MVRSILSDLSTVRSLAGRRLSPPAARRRRSLAQQYCSLAPVIHAVARSGTMRSHPVTWSAGSSAEAAAARRSEAAAVSLDSVGAVALLPIGAPMKLG